MQTKLSSCGLTTIFLVFAISQTTKCQSSLNYRPVVELALYMDAHLWQHGMQIYGNANAAERNLRLYAESIVSMAQTIYRHPSMKPSIELRVVHFEIWRQQPREFCDSCIGKVGNAGDANKMLQIFQHWQSARGNWDAAILMTGLWETNAGVDGGVGGLAYAGSACTPEWRVGVINVFASPANLPHELAHLLDMHHDPDENVSTPSEEQERRGFVWSATRLKSFHDFSATLDRENRNCLRRTNVRDSSIFTIRSNASETFPPDMQCHWYGYSERSFPQRSAEWCSTIVCSAGAGYQPQAHYPALSGTPCGRNGYCAVSMDWSEGHSKCVDRNYAYTALDSYNFANGDCPGNDVGSRRAGITLEQCAIVCDQLPSCRAFIYRHGVCNPKSGHCGLQLRNSADKSFQFFLKSL